MNMKISKILSIVLTFASVVAMISCGGGKDEPDAPEVITRVKDVDGKVFVENSQMIVATTAFSGEQLQEVLSASRWARSYDLFYDKDHVSGKISLAESQFPVALVDGTKAVFPLGTSRGFTQSGKTLTIARDMLSGTYRPDDIYTVVALDYSDSVKRIITDKPAAGFATIPEGYDFQTTYIRTVWVGE
ncbi:MAG: hypothetical protein Q4B68_07460 [Bacteroidales bacterium]|nr:hypothetical protein [Bacteroidales bacterium]